MVKEETTLGYQPLMVDTIKRYVIPECLCTDYRTVFQSANTMEEADRYITRHAEAKLKAAT